MLTMGMSGSALALRQSLTSPNLLGGFTSAYFVVTALTTVRPPSPSMRVLDRCALAVAVALTLFEITLGVTALQRPGGTLHGVRFFMLFFLATITTLGAAGDIRVMRSGPLKGGGRLARHLWRMCFAQRVDLRAADRPSE